MLLTAIIARIQKMFEQAEKPATYGSELEAYIVSKNPQSTYDVEFWTKQFDKTHSKGWTL